MITFVSNLLSSIMMNFYNIMTTTTRIENRSIVSVSELVQAIITTISSAQDFVQAPI